MARNFGEKNRDNRKRRTVKSTAKELNAPNGGFFRSTLGVKNKMEEYRRRSSYIRKNTGPVKTFYASPEEIEAMLAAYGNPQLSH